MINKVVLFSILIVVFFLNGCTSKETRVMISKYAEVSNVTQTNVLNTYKDAIKNEQQFLYYKAIRDGASIKELTARKIEYSGQQKALKDLAEFTGALAKISSDKYFEDIDKNSVKLYSSAKSLSENNYLKDSADISKEDIKLFTSILNAGTKGYVEHLKTEQLKEIMLVSDKWVQKTLDNLDTDLISWKRHLKKSLRNRKNIELFILNNPHTYCRIKDKNKECYVLQESFKSKLELYSEVKSIQKRIDNLDKEFEALKDSIALMSELHTDIISSIKDDKLDDILIKTLKRNYKRLNELSNSISSYRNIIKDK